MARVFAYIEHSGGVADDTAAEIAAAARKIDSATSPTAVVTGWGAELDAVSEGLRSSYDEIWKIGNPALAYPNAEVVRKALVDVLPHDSVVLIPHAHFGIDLGPGLSIKMDSVYLPDALEIDGVEGGWLKAVRQEFGGQVSAHVRCDISSGAVISVRPGAFKPLESAPQGGTVVDKSSAVGTLAAKRRYLETVVAEAGDVDIKKEPVLVSIGRGIQEKDNISHRPGIGRRYGRGSELLATRGRCQVAGKIAPGRLIRPNRQTEGLHGLRHQWFVAAPGRDQG